MASYETATACYKNFAHVSKCVLLKKGWWKLVSKITDKSKENVKYKRVNLDYKNNGSLLNTFTFYIYHFIFYIFLKDFNLIPLIFKKNVPSFLTLR